MQKAMTILLALVLLGARAVAQDAPAAPAAPVAPGSPAPAVAPAAAESPADALAVQEQLRRDRERRKQQEAEIQAKLVEAKMKMEELKAREKQQESEIPRLDKDLALAKARMEDAYRTLSTVSIAYVSAEAKERDANRDKVIGEFQAVYDKNYKEQLNRHESDLDFIARNKWSPADFDHLELPVSKEDSSRVLVFDGANGNKVSGWFQTMGFEAGVKTWHQIPPDATFSPLVQNKNPFVADVSLHLGVDLLKCGSTNMLDWDIHVFIGKDFTKQAGDSNRYELVGFSWPVDLGRPVCWQCGEPPVFHLTPRPVQKKATELVPDIAAKLKEWVYADEGMKKRKEDAGLSHKTAVHTYNREDQKKPIRVDQINRKIAELKDKQKEAQKQIDDFEMMLDEYKEEVPVVPPAEAGASTNAVQEGL